MQTTLDIDDDVLQAALELARRDGRPVGEVISELVRKGLGAAQTRIRNGVPILPSQGGLITNEHVQRLMDEEGI